MERCDGHDTVCNDNNQSEEDSEDRDPIVDFLERHLPLWFNMLRVKNILEIIYFLQNEIQGILFQFLSS
jgi:hypothetical protein